MTVIKILNSSLLELATINQVVTCSQTEKINSDKVLNFTLPLTAEIGALINDTNVIGLGTDYYDIAKYKKSGTGGKHPMVDVECEHISYRLNDAAYNVEYFTETGTPIYILGKILAGTGFSVGTVDFTAQITYSAQEAKSRRALLMELVATLGGEMQFDGFTVSILQQRGSTIAKDLTTNEHLTVLSKSVDKRSRDKNGNPTYSYECSLAWPVETYSLGDVVNIDSTLLDIDVTLRIVCLTTNPYSQHDIEFEVGNYVNALEDDLYRIETGVVSKDAKYNGCRIGPEFGFEAVRNDKKARAFLCSDKLALQAGDGTGTNWTDKLYYDYDSETGAAILVFDGKLSAGVIEAVQATFNVVVTNTFITQTLAAETGTIAELTVDRLETSTKVKNYLNSDTSDVNYIKAEGQYIQWITATTEGVVGPGQEQATDRNSTPLYWIDETHTGTTTEETNYPVMVYVYIEMIKASIGFELECETYEPTITLGVGSDPESETKGKAVIHKSIEGLNISYHHSTNDTEYQLTITDAGLRVIGNSNSSGLKNIYIGTNAPANPDVNDIWIDTGA
jgi:hypothetical protein